MTTHEMTGDDALAAIKLAMERGPTALVVPRQPKTPGEAIAAADGKPTMVAVFTVEDGELRLCRYTNDFPNGDFPKAAELLRADLDRECPWLFSPQPE